MDEIKDIPETIEHKKPCVEEAVKPIEAILEGIPEKKKEEIKSIIRTIQFFGPLPPPGILKQYYEIDPELLKTIKELPEKEQAHRHKMTEGGLHLKIYEAKTDRREIIIGQIFGFLISTIAIVAGSYTSLHGQPFIGGLIGAGGVAGLASAFIVGRKKLNKKIN